MKADINLMHAIKYIFSFCIIFTVFSSFAEEFSIREIKEIIESIPEKCKGENCNHSDNIINSKKKVDNRDLQYKEIAKLIVLNKITAKSEELQLNLGQMKFFGNLSIEVHKCVKNTSIYDDYNMMLVSIFDNKLDDDKVLIFYGWLVSQHPSLSTLEHPVYEIIPKDCL